MANRRGRAKGIFGSGSMAGGALLAGVVLLGGCGGGGGSGGGADGGSEATEMEIVVVEEAFLTPKDATRNLDSPAIWHGPDGEVWLLVTGKTSERIHVYDAATGRPLQAVGGSGPQAPEFQRPNGIAVLGDLLLVVERNNARVQVLRLPDFEPLTTFGEEELRRPYGIAVLERDTSEAEVFITDDFRAWFDVLGDLEERVKRYRLRTVGDAISVDYLGEFGETSGPGRLRKVESLAVDRAAEVVLIADERSGDVKLYRTDGRFTGRVLWADLIRHEPEGIVLYPCGEADGYWVIADQHPEENRFLVFDRASFELRGIFAGRVVRQTDGVALSARPVGPMSAGALYAVHDDRAVVAFSWIDVARALGLRSDCAGGADS